jgi:putative hemolysin
MFGAEIPLLSTGVDAGLLPGGQLANIAIVVLCLLVVAFFSSSEASLISVNKFRIRHLAEQGDHSARAVLRVVDEHEKFFATILLTENAFIILASSVGTALAISYIGSSAYSVLVATLLMTLLVVVFGEITPKSLAARASERWSLVVAPPVQRIMALETPILFIFTAIPRLVLRLIGGAGKLVTPSVTEGELRMLIDTARAEGMVEHEEADRLESVFRFGDRQVREVMTPRTEIVFVESGTILGEFLKTYAEHSHTRFPVYKGSMDNIVGILSTKDVLKAMSSRDIDHQEPITDVIRDAYFVPETKRIAELFDESRQTGNQMAIAIDEFGGIAGLVSLKSLLEEVVGRVGEEGISPEEEYEALGEDRFQVDGGMSIDEANEELDVRLPAGDYETVAGFVLEFLGHIPKDGEQFDYRDLSVEVTEMKDLKIETVVLTRRQGTA